MNKIVFELNDKIGKVPLYAYFLHIFGIHYCRKSSEGVFYCRICGNVIFEDTKMKVKFADIQEKNCELKNKDMKIKIALEALDFYKKEKNYKYNKGKIELLDRGRKAEEAILNMGKDYE